MKTPSLSEPGGFEAQLAELLRDDSEEELLMKKIEAEAPVPERLLPKRTGLTLVARLKLSQKIGLLLWLNQEGILSSGGKERLIYLQRDASEEALIAGIKFSSRLKKEVKLQSDFRPHMVELNRPVQSRRYRKKEARRIGVGYRDKGTLPDHSHKARLRSNQEAFVHTGDVPSELLDLVSLRSPLAITEDGQWIDLSQILQEDFLNAEGDLIPLPNPL